MAVADCRCQHCLTLHESQDECLSEFTVGKPESLPRNEPDWEDAQLYFIFSRGTYFLHLSFSKLNSRSLFFQHAPTNRQWISDIEGERMQ